MAAKENLCNIVSDYGTIVVQDYNHDILLKIKEKLV